MAQNISNQDDVIDSRDVIARIEELEGIVPPSDEDEGYTNEEHEELATLRALADECEQYASDWEYGETLIRDSYFADYARELLEDTETLPKDLPWYVVVDWEATAEHIQGDYTRVDFDGVDYWIRSV